MALDSNGAAMKILLTGFGPFPGIESNHTQTIAEHFKKNSKKLEYQLITSIIPVTFSDGKTIIPKLIEEHHPDYVLVMGVKSTSSEFCLEKIAINALHSTKPDFKGNFANHEKILTDAREAFFSDIDLCTWCQDLNEKGILAAVTYSAGTYVCNQTFYLFSHYLSKYSSSNRVVLLHVPRLPSQIPEDSNDMGMEYNTILEGVKICLELAYLDYKSSA